MIDNNDELVLIGNVKEDILDEIWLHEDCLKSNESDWNGLSTYRNNKIGIVKLNANLEYLRSGIVPGAYYMEFFDESTSWIYPNAGSDAILDENNNILITHGLKAEYQDDYLKEGSETFKNGTADYHLDAALVKISSDLTQILYSTVYGGSGDDAPGFMFVQDSIVTIIGTTGSTDLVVTPGADVPYPQYQTEKLFVVTLNTNSPVSVPDSPEKQYIYPNPASTYLELPEELVNRFSEFVITDLLGRSLVSHALQSNRIDISTLPTGTYNLALTNSTSRSSYLFVKTE
ncbi:MAG: T9SS type A sorting domain-containing protein [Desulfobulbaceae bacterium]|nr:T9SS type A sorting domain-containing protein [Desulfobulbaceae bacterium]